MTDEITETKYSDLFPEDSKQYSNGEEQPKVKRTRRPRGSGTTGRVATITKDSIKSALELANLGLVLSAKEFALVPEEIDELTNAWYEIVKQYPSVGKYLVIGQKLGMWGNLLFIHYQIVMRRYNIVAANNAAKRAAHTDTTGTTRPASRDDRERENNASGTVARLA